MRRFTVQLTSRKNGNGEDMPGWYVCDYNIPVGCPRATKEESLKDLHIYIADIRRMACL
jgi:hypothetical protein